jgi:ferritin
MAIKKPGDNQSTSDTYDSKSRVSKKIKERLDYQIKVEVEASQIYRAMAQWCDFKGYHNAASYLSRHAEEEMQHMKKVQSYMQDRNCMPTTPSMIKPASEFTDLVDVIKKAYEHEKFVSDTYQEFAKIACMEGDYITHAWMQWFLKEQIEEERKFSNILDKIEMMKKEGVGMLEIESEISNGDLVACKSC